MVKIWKYQHQAKQLHEARAEGVQGTLREINIGVVGRNSLGDAFCAIFIRNRLSASGGGINETIIV